MEDIFVGRQPILDRNQELIGYELLFRDGDRNAADFSDGRKATAQVIFNTFMDIGLENIVGSHPAFLNLPHSFFLEDNPLPVTREQVVMELLEDVLPEQRVLERIDHFRKAGYLIALDDFVYKPELSPLLERADFVKLDVLQHDEQALRELITRLRRYDVKLIAEKVETPEQFSLCKQLGFDCYQGFYFSRPHVIKDRPLPNNRLVLLNLLTKLQADTDFSEIEKLILQDATLSYRLLRYINCATFALRREIDSIHQAIVLLGVNNIRNWASMLMMSRLNNEKPKELLVSSLTRARMAELLAGKYALENKEQYFTVGLLSNLDALLDKPMEDLLDHIPLSTTIKMALLDAEGRLGEILQGVVLYEHSEWERLKKLSIDIEAYRAAYLAAIQWADENINALGTTDS